MKKYLFTLICLLFTYHSWATVFQVKNEDGVTIYYSVLSSSTCAVCGNGNANSYSGDVKVPSSVEYKGKMLDVVLVASSTFRNCTNLTSVILPNSIERIGTNVFEYSSNLKEVVIPSSVTEFGSSAFSYCSNLMSVKFNCRIKKIDSFFFEDCYNLGNIIIPSTVEEVNSRAFAGCTSMTDFIVANGNKHLTTIDGVLFNADTTSFIGFPAGRAVNHYSIPSGVKTIKYMAFNKNPYITSITIPSSVTKVEMHALSGNPKLEKIRIEATTPPECEVYALGLDGKLTITLEVPAGSKAAYEANSEWNKCWEIVEYNPNDGSVNSDSQKKCAMPTISYSEGKLKFSCETEDVEFCSSITNEDIRAYNTQEIDLAKTYNISVYAKKVNYASSDEVKAILVWATNPQSSVTTLTKETSIESIPLLITQAEGKVTVGGLQDNVIITAYSVDGTKVATSKAIGNTTTLNLSSLIGKIALLKVDGKSAKILIK